jgi:ATP-binding cassette subfamily F protein 3
MAVRFKSGGRGGDQVLVTDKLTVKVADRVLLNQFSGIIRRNDVVALVGPNGTGKTTLLSTMLGDRPAASGSARLGDAIQMTVYRQDLAQVPRDKNLFDIIHDLRPMWTRGQVMDHLGRFDFSGDETLRRAGSLSGGELARVALAMMTLEQVHFLIFDEPTNHLDVESIESLEDAIEAYEGTVLLVSHDRALLNALSTRVWHLENGKITDYDGNFAEWEQARDDRRRADDAAAKVAETARRAREKQADAKKPPSSEKKGQASVQRTARRAVEQAEARVQQLEREVASRSAALADSNLYSTPDGTAKAKTLAKELDFTKAELERAFATWEAAVAEAERLAANG